MRLVQFALLDYVTTDAKLNVAFDIQTRLYMRLFCKTFRNIQYQ